MKAVPLHSSQNLGKTDGNSGSPRLQQKPASEDSLGLRIASHYLLHAKDGQMEI